MKLFILGAGDLSREILATIRTPGCKTESFEEIIMADDDHNKIDTVIDRVRVVSIREALLETNSRFICGIGTTGARRKIVERARMANCTFVNVIHPHVTVFEGVRMGSGIYIAANTTLNISCSISDNTVVNCNCSIGHDTEIGEGCVISPGCVISGRNRIGNNVFIGSGVVTFQGVSIGDNSQISANSTISRKVKENTRVLPYVKNHMIPVSG